jgi:hypothetical protein
MPEDRYVWCRSCNDVYHVTPFSKAPTYSWNGEEALELPTDDWGAFTRAHAGHRLEPLWSVGEPFRPGGADPMSERFVEVTDGSRRFVVRAFRESVAKPLRFELIPGKLRLAPVAVGVQEKEIRREMAGGFRWHPDGKIEGEEIERVIAAFREVVSALSAAEIEAALFDSPRDSLTYGLLPDRAVRLLREKCSSFLSPEQLCELQRFIETENVPDGVATLVLRRRADIVSSDQSCRSGEPA